MLKHPEVQEIIQSAHRQRLLAISRRIEDQSERLFVSGTVSLIEFFTMDTDGLIRLKNVEELTANQIRAIENMELNDNGELLGIRLKEPVKALTELTRLMETTQASSDTRAA